MKTSYCYGYNDLEILYSESLDEAIGDFLTDNLTEAIIEEYKVDRKNGERWCPVVYEFLSYGDCGKQECDDYIPRNGVKGICKHQSWGLKKTGRKWKIEYIDDFCVSYSVDKISPRKYKRKSYEKII